MSVEPGSPVAALPIVGIVRADLAAAAGERDREADADAGEHDDPAGDREHARVGLPARGRRPSRRRAAASLPRAPCLLRFLAARHRREE